MRYLLLISCLALTVGCASKRPATEPSSESEIAPADEAIVEAKSSVTPIPPIAVEIAQAFIDADDLLQVKAVLESRTTIPAAGVNVRLIGLANGEVLGEQSVLLSEILGKQFIQSKERVSVAMTLPSAGLTEYQVETSWGLEEGSRARLSGRENEALYRTPVAPVRLVETQIDFSPAKCKTPPCGRNYTLRTKLINGTQKPIEKVWLAVGLLWVNEGDRITTSADFARLNPYEEVVEVDSLNLQPNAQRVMKIALERSVPSLPGGAFHPVVRLYKVQ